MSSRVFLTVDTELTWRHHRDGEGWRENFERSFEAAGVGIPYQLETLAAHGLKACFFVDPMPALLFGIEPVERMVAPILAAGQEVQLHVHPFWERLAEGDEGTLRFELCDYDLTQQRRLIATARDLLVSAGAPTPTAFRAGSYAANGNTLAALAQLGIRYDSSHNGSHHPRPSAIPLRRRQIAPIAINGVVEIPVSQIEERPGRLRHLQICAVSFDELRSALLHARRHHHPATTIVSHSFELATRDGLRVNQMLRRRFERLCRFLADHRATLPTASFGALDDIDLDAGSQPSRGRPDRTIRRVAGQLWGGSRYERPVESLTATSGSSLPGIEALLPYVV